MGVSPLEVQILSPAPSFITACGVTWQPTCFGYRDVLVRIQSGGPFWEQGETARRLPWKQDMPGASPGFPTNLGEGLVCR